MNSVLRASAVRPPIVLAAEGLTLAGAAAAAGPDGPDGTAWIRPRGFEWVSCVGATASTS